MLSSSSAAFCAASLTSLKLSSLSGGGGLKDISSINHDEEGWGPWSQLRPFDLTPCFEDAVLVNVPRLLLLLIALPRLLLVIWRRPPFAVPKDWRYQLKVALPLVLAMGWALQLVNMVASNGNDHSGGSDTHVKIHSLLAVSTAIASYAFAAWMHHLEQLRSAIGSSALLLFWLGNIITDFIVLRTTILLGSPSDLPAPFPSSKLILLSVTLIISLIIFILENLPKPLSYYGLLPTSEEEANAADASKLASSPESHANIFSRVFFLWMDPLMKLGYQKDLDLDDLWALRKIDSSNYVSEQFMRRWKEETGRARPSLLRAIARTYGAMFACAAIFKVIQDCLSFIQPTFLRWIMEFTASWSPENKGFEQPISRGFAIACMMLIAALFQTIFLHQYFHLCITMGMRLKICLISAIYQKSLRLSNASRQSSTVGEIVNLMSVDAGRIADLCQYFHIIWSGPFQICLAIYFLFNCLGSSIFAGVAFMVLMIPVNAILATRSRALNKRQMGNKDARTKLMDEVLSGIKVIKLYAWESPFLKKIDDIREKELSTLKSIGYLSAMQSLCWGATPFFVSFLSFGLYSMISNEPLTSTKVFVSLALFNLLQFPLNVFPSVISSIIDASVSFSRLYNFLRSEELDSRAVKRESMLSGNVGAAALLVSSSTNPIERIAFKNGTFHWDKTSTEPILSGVSVSVSDRQLVAVVGVVGSGKSSLLSAILGEMYKTQGDVVTRGTIAYVPQTPWIMNATLRDNITFGKRYDSKLYDSTIEACGLKPDLDMLPGGDMTEIGERGINLSGGQKQRISLARAVYSQADIYLLDDTLSAVDAHVGRHIFDNVIGPRGLLRRKARLFVTHSIHHLHEVDYILMLSNGKSVESGSYEELMRKGDGGAVHALIKEYGKRREESAEPTLGATKSMTTVLSVECLNSKDDEHMKKIVPQESKTVLITKEESTKGSVSMSVYAAYIMSCGLQHVAIYLLLALVQRILGIAQDIYLADWADANDRKSTKILRGLSLADEPTDDNVVMRLAIYGALGLSSSFTLVFQVIFVWIYCGIRSARILHSQMLHNIFRLPQSYFDTTPLGRIINRFSKDVYTVDEVLPRSFQGFIGTMSRVLGILAVNVMGNWLFIFFIMPLGVLYMFFQRYYLATSRELKRLESTSRSPIYANFQETLNGVSTIRAYGQSARFITSNEARVDYHMRAYYPSVSSNRWLAVRLETIGSLIVFASALFPVLSLFINGYVSASIVGLGLTYSLSVTQTLNWMVRQSAEIETNIVSVERMQEYIKLPQEAAYKIPERQPKKDWPEEGKIEFKNYSTRYREGLDLVLKDVSFSVRPKEKIGIVGRTGAGKSSLTLALFRLIESASGKILIDEIDISTLGQYDLRSRMTIIPQDALLFNGTVRDNLDPFRQRDDAALWAALDAANLKSAVAKLEGGLDSPVLPCGENYSCGQRQLICLARAVLRESKILVLDEATAAIDYETDAIIQRTIRKIAEHSTVVCIAHRINTIIDYDRILVLSEGRVSEMDTPSNLLANKNSVFYSLAKEAGLAK